MNKLALVKLNGTKAEPAAFFSLLSTNSIHSVNQQLYYRSTEIHLVIKGISKSPITKTCKFITSTGL